MAATCALRRLGVITVFALAACAIVTKEDYQRGSAEMLRPAEVRPATADPASGATRSLRVLRVRAWADPGFRAHEPRWAEAIPEQLRRVNAVLEPDFDIRLEVVAVQPWAPRVDVDRAPCDGLDELARHDPARDVDWVVGWTGPVPETRVRDQIGCARAFSPYFVVRAMESTADVEWVENWDALTPEEREAMRWEHRSHKETSTFLHEWAHTLGAVHECVSKWLMAPEYTVLASRFSPESARLVRLGLAHRSAQTAETVRAWASAYADAVATMRRATWDCAEMERDLAANGKVLTTSADHAAGREAAPAGGAAR
jgi:hypothetical protein